MCSSDLPCLGSIPLLGWAFKTVSDGGERTNMYVFITPRVVKGSLEAQQLYKEKREHADSALIKGDVSLFDKIKEFEDTMSGKPVEKPKP